MKYFVYQLEEEGYLNRFMTTGTYAEEQTFKRVVLSGKVNEWLDQDFSIYENPCRKEFVNRRRGSLPDYVDISRFDLQEEISVFGQRRRLAFYYPFGNQGVDFSDFYFNPSYLRCYSYVSVFSKREEKALFQLETCGGLTLWVNDCLVADFIPFTRNKKKVCTVAMTLKQGFNKLVVCLDDLAERDTDYYFRIRYLGREQLKLCLPVGDEVDVKSMDRIEQALSQIYFDRETYISEPVVLRIRNPLDQSITVHAVYKPVADKMYKPESLAVHKSYELKAGMDRLVLFEAEDVVPGFYYIKVRAGINGVWAERTIATQVFHKELLAHRERVLVERKKEAIRYLTVHEVSNVYKAAAILAAGGSQEQAEHIILMELKGIQARKDCSDFHLIVVLQIWKLFGDKLSEETLQAVRETVLGFRYWIDEPGNDVMWFFSENHALLFHICQYYAGKWLSDEVFSNSGLTGREQLEKAEILLGDWFEAYFKEFITEWNSNAYIPVDVLGLCGLYNLAEEGSRWQKIAKRALDFIFRDMALNGHKGAVMTTFGRSYEKESKGNYAAGTTSLLYLAYGTGYLNRAALAYCSVILGDYAPPAEYKQYLELKDSQALIYEKTQGFQEHVNLYMYKNSRVQLSTAISFHPFTQGYQEHIMQATLDPVAQMYVNHPGEVQPYGNGRPNYWAGNGSLPFAVQYENLGIMVYRIPKDHPVKFTHAYVPLMEFDRYVGTEDTVAAEKDGGYIGVRSLNGLLPTTEGPCRGREYKSLGLNHVWILKVGTVEEYASLSQFCMELSHMEITWQEGDFLKVADARLGDLMVSDQNLTVNGRPVYRYPVSWKGEVTWKHITEKRME